MNIATAVLGGIGNFFFFLPVSCGLDVPYTSIPCCGSGQLRSLCFFLSVALSSPSFCSFFFLFSSFLLRDGFGGFLFLLSLAYQ